MTGVTITLDNYHSPIDTFPRNCATPRVWVKNQSNEAVRSVDVTFKVSIYDVTAEYPAHRT